MIRSSHRRAALVASVCLAAAATAPAAAHAQSVPPACQGFLNYSVNYLPGVNFSPNAPGIVNTFTMNSYRDGSTGMTWPFQAAGQSFTLTDPFYKDFCTNPPQQGFLLGILGYDPALVSPPADPAADPWDPTNPASKYHVVMALNMGVGPNVVGRSLDDIFGVDENALLNAIHYGASVDCDFSTGGGLGCAGLDFVSDFGMKVRTGPNGLGVALPAGSCGLFNGQVVCGPTFNTANGWFDIPGGGPNTTYDLVRFSDGALVGTGAVTVSGLATAVPEPGTWVLMLTGLGALGFREVVRRRRLG